MYLSLYERMMEKINLKSLYIIIRSNIEVNKVQ